MRLLGLSGSLRAGSHNRRLLDVAASVLPAEVSMEIYQGLRDVPPYQEDADAPEAVVALRDAIEAADAVLIATPEYNGSIPGLLKNALDWASRPYPDNALRAKPVAVIGASTGVFGAVWAQAELRKVLGVIGADVLDAELPVGLADDAFTDDGALADAALHEALAELVGKLVDAAHRAVNA